eukprot:888277-Pelagomonas_calceolata.AAC.4
MRTLLAKDLRTMVLTSDTCCCCCCCSEAASDTPAAAPTAAGEAVSEVGSERQRGPTQGTGGQAQPQPPPEHHKPDQEQPQPPPHPPYQMLCKDDRQQQQQQQQDLGQPHPLQQQPQLPQQEQQPVSWAQSCPGFVRNMPADLQRAWHALPLHVQQDLLAQTTGEGHLHATLQSHGVPPGH